MTLLVLGAISFSSLAKAYNIEHMKQFLKTKKCENCDLSLMKSLIVNNWMSRLAGNRDQFIVDYVTLIIEMNDRECSEDWKITMEKELRKKWGDISISFYRSGDNYFVDFRGAQLKGSNLSGAELLNIDLSNADLTNAMFVGANLNESRLRRVNLTNTNMNSSYLFKTDLTGSYWKGQIPSLGNAYRVLTKGLDSLPLWDFEN